MLLIVGGSDARGSSSVLESPINAGFESRAFASESRPGIEPLWPNLDWYSDASESLTSSTPGLSREGRSISSEVMNVVFWAAWAIVKASGLLTSPFKASISKGSWLYFFTGLHSLGRRSPVRMIFFFERLNFLGADTVSRVGGSMLFVIRIL